MAKPVALLTEVKQFFDVRFLYWLEVMSLTEEVVAANIALLGVAGWIQVSELSTELQCTLKGNNIVILGV